MKGVLGWHPHKFQPYPGGRYPNSCIRCGKAPDAPIHEVVSDDSTPEKEEQDGEGS